MTRLRVKNEMKEVFHVKTKIFFIFLFSEIFKILAKISLRIFSSSERKPQRQRGTKRHNGWKKSWGFWLCHWSRWEMNKFVSYQQSRTRTTATTLNVEKEIAQRWIKNDANAGTQISLRILRPIESFWKLQK